MRAGTINRAPDLAGHGPLLFRYAILAVPLAGAATLFVDRAADAWLIEPACALLLIAAAALAVLWPVLDQAAGTLPMAQLIAFVGCDGSGKSTLSGDVLTDLAHVRRVELCYLGLGSGALGERIRRLPLIGRYAERRLSKKASQTRTRGQTIPGLPTAIVVYLFSVLRLRRFRRMLAVRRSGVTVITDRYPQIEVPGFYDGPGLSAAQPGNWLVASLARRERRMYEWMASFRPDVVIRLNVDADTAHARKPDHGYELLRKKVLVTPELRFNGARIVDLDSRLPYAAVRAAVDQIVAGTLALRKQAA